MKRQALLMRMRFAAISWLTLAACETGDQVPGSITVSAYDSFCRGQGEKEVVKDSNLPPVNAVGLNPRNYDRSRWFQTTIQLRDVRPDALGRLREDYITTFADQHESEMLANIGRTVVLRDAVKQLFAEPPVSWNPTDSLRLLAEHASLLSDLVYQAGDISRFVTVFEHEAFSNCRAGTYNYRVSFWMLKSPVLAYSEPVRREWERRIYGRIDPKLDTLARGGGPVTINTKEDIFDRLYGDEVFRRRVAELLTPGDSAVLRYGGAAARYLLESVLDPTTPVYPFASGSCEVPDDMAYAIELVVQRFKDLRRPGEDYRIISRGFADSDPINGPIACKSMADLTQPQYGAAPLGRTSGGSIVDNLDLSIARGFAAAQRIDEVLRSDESDQRAAVEVLYSGGGEVPGIVRDSHRRIDIVIESMRSRVRR